MLAHRTPSLFPLVLVLLGASCSTSPRAEEPPPKPVLDAADLRALGPDDWVTPGSILVRYRTEDWEAGLRGIETLDRLPPELPAGPLVLGFELPAPDGPLDPGLPLGDVLVTVICREGCTPYVGPGPADEPGWVWCRCNPKEESGSGSIGVDPKPMCGLRLTPRGPQCVGFCPENECRLRRVRLTPWPKMHLLLPCECR